MSKDLNIGQIIETEQARDAIHCAVAPVEAGERLSPGGWIRLNDQGRAVFAMPAVAIGVVDPFLTKTVSPGQRFWLFLMPGSITSLRHDFTHPGLDSVKMAPTGKSRAWLEHFAAHYGVNVDDLIRAASSGNTSGVSAGYMEFSERCQDDEFWKHIEVVTGKHFDNHHREAVYFRCAC